MTTKRSLILFGIRMGALRGVAVAIPAGLGVYVIATPAMPADAARLTAAVACGMALTVTVPVLWEFVVRWKAFMRHFRYGPGTCNCPGCLLKRSQQADEGEATPPVEKTEVPTLIVGDSRDVGPNPRYWH